MAATARAGAGQTLERTCFDRHRFPPQPALPRADDPPIDGDDRRHRVPPSDQPLRVPRLDHRAAVLVRGDELVVDRKEVRRGRRDVSRACGRKPQPAAVRLDAPQVGLDRLESLAGVGHREPGPFREIVDGCRTAAPEVARGELGQRLVPFERAALRSAVVEERVGELLPLPGTAAHDPVELGHRHDVRHALDPQRSNPGACQHLPHLIARARIPVEERLPDRRAGAAQRSRVQLELLVSIRQPGLEARRGQGEEPADVGGQDEVPGRSQQVGAQDGAVVERPLHVFVDRGSHPRTERPLRGRIVLGLDGTKPFDRRGRRAQRRAAETQVVEPPREDVRWARLQCRSAAAASSRVWCTVPSGCSGGLYSV